ncbi:DUF1990 domain-containing protein [Schumannella luteola]|uniref:Uncharacterized protein (UPF0548 family) n=1 Tax=Schumannella luteola TaxID=472059 RepID=A0A852YSR3_9MICO|nr:DUF1990 domain-containing protein [Schumannella luteola]NYH00326.1 uncharacterized protein (UPF0548 family) [Schumannella luteola]TPX05986.1 DUF1990 domain-containing protein [Schumannella luteola]
MSRRAPIWERAVSYAAVGATRAADLMEYPPTGYRPLERRALIGHGPARWEHAWTETLTWGIQQRSGFRVEVVETPAELDRMGYTPVGFDDDGAPIAPAVVDSSGERIYAADGRPLLRPGDTAWLGIPFGPLRLRFPARVVYVVDEPNRRGFAYGTLPGHAERGEEAFIVERSDDGSVWVSIRAFSRPGGFFWWLVNPVLRLTQGFYTARYLRALATPLAADTAPDAVVPQPAEAAGAAAEASGDSAPAATRDPA